MASLSKLWVHAVWSTKYRQHLIIPEIEEKVHNTIRNQFFQMGCEVLIVNGISDHVHCLFRMKRTQTIAEIIKHVKGGSSYQINSRTILTEKFAWQKGYGAFSVNYDELQDVYNYILNQKEHHRLNPNYNLLQPWV